MRKDVTQNTAESFEELIAQLWADGFNVDHFHAVDFLESGEEHVSHLNLWKEGDEVFAHWEDGPANQHEEPLNDDPRGWPRLVADEWHE